MSQRQAKNSPRRNQSESSTLAVPHGILRVGPAGWSYPDWAGYVYPSRRPKGFHEAAYLAEFFDTIEINTSFYQPLRPDLAAHMIRLMTNSNSCTASFTQIAGIEAIRGDQSSVDRMRDEFQRRRDVFVAGLNKIRGFSCRMPKGAFYAFPNITQTGRKSKPLADALLEQAGVAALSGTAFGEFGEGYLRFSVANSLENLQQALDRLDEWTKKNL